MRRLLFLIVGFVGMWLVDAQVAFARAGGGGGYSSGGGGSSSSYSGSGGYSSGSGGSGGGDFTAFHAIIVLVAFACLVMASRKQSAAVKAAMQNRALESKMLAARIRERDPNFELDALAHRVRRAFMAIQEAWSNQDLEAVRGFMSDGLHERFSIQLREQRAAGYRNAMSNIKIRECCLVDVEDHAHFDVVSFRISASASDVRIDAGSGREIPNSRRSESFTEVWTFLRGRNASNVAAGGLFEGQCPNCAAPVDPRRAWSCESCGSGLDTAPPDWVLIEITQLSEWSGRGNDEPHWLKAAVTRDPGITEQQLEDRASVLFWRLMDAERIGDSNELASVARASFLDAQRIVRARSGDGYIGDCAVGAVILRGIIPGTEWDLALVEIRWSGGQFVRSAAGPPEATGSRSLRRSLLVMARRSGVESSLGRCIVSAHCHRCGAPDDGGVDPGCGFCGAPLNDGSDWLIADFHHWGDREATTLLNDLDNPRSTPSDLVARSEELSAASVTPRQPAIPGGMALYGWALAIVYSDRNLDRRERAALRMLAERLGIPDTTAHELRQAAQFGRLEVEQPVDAAEARLWLESLIEVAKADGHSKRSERRLLDEIRSHANL